MKNMIFPLMAVSGMMALFSGGILNAQNECRVLKPEISRSYTGDCKKGLAHGKGSAMGTDYYEGRFSRGLPDGNGKYTWKDGAVYEGEWSMGMRDGKGTMYYTKDSVLTGFWKEDAFAGAFLVPAYVINRQSGVTRSSIVKMSETGSGFRVGIYLAGKFNTDVEDLNILSDSGEEYNSGRYVAIQNAIVPYSVKIKYRTWNALHTSQSDVVFEFNINEPGTFEVSITH